MSMGGGGGGGNDMSVWGGGGNDMSVVMSVVTGHYHGWGMMGVHSYMVRIGRFCSSPSFSTSKPARLLFTISTIFVFPP